MSDFTPANPLWREIRVYLERYRCLGDKTRMLEATLPLEASERRIVRGLLAELGKCDCVIRAQMKELERWDAA